MISRGGVWNVTNNFSVCVGVGVGEYAGRYMRKRAVRKQGRACGQLMVGWIPSVVAPLTVFGGGADLEKKS